MPKALLDFLGYTFYFYSNENGEPIHIHVSKGKPSENSTKFWIKRDGMSILGFKLWKVRNVRKKEYANRRVFDRQFFDSAFWRLEGNR